MKSRYTLRYIEFLISYGIGRYVKTLLATIPIYRMNFNPHSKIRTQEISL